MKTLKLQWADIGSQVMASSILRAESKDPGRDAQTMTDLERVGMRLPRILNQCHPIPGFVYQRAEYSDGGQTILIPVRPRKRSAAICSGCHQPAPGYDQSRTPRRFEFIGFWGYLVFLVYCMRRVNCQQCGVVVEEVPWGLGKHSSTKVQTSEIVIPSWRLSATRRWF